MHLKQKTKVDWLKTSKVLATATAAFVTIVIGFQNCGESFTASSLSLSSDAENGGVRIDAATTPSQVVNISADYNVYGITASGSEPASGGLDGHGYAFASSATGASVAYEGLTFNFGAVGKPNAVSEKQIVLPHVSSASLYIIAAATNGEQTQQFTITYTDNSTTKLNVSISDWGTSSAITGETIVKTAADRVTPAGALGAGAWKMYGHTLALDSAKTPASLTLPSDRNVIVFGVGLGPSTTVTTVSGVPAPAQQYGFDNLTFNSVQIAPFASNTTYEFPENTGGFYYADYWGQKPVAGEAVTAGGTLTLDGEINHDGYGSVVSTATYNPLSKAANPMTGVAFGGGWYYETTFTITERPGDTTNHYTADTMCIWAISVESVVNRVDSWVEMDGPEFNRDYGGILTAINSVGVSLHNWYKPTTGTSQQKRVDNLTAPATLPAGKYISGKHTWGNLWVPATTSTPGLMKWYFDGALISQTSWAKYTGDHTEGGTLAPSGAQIGAVIDTQHLMPVLSNKDPNLNLVFNSVHIWQGPGASNFRQ